MNIVGCIPRFFNRFGGWILTALSGVGVVATSVLVANEAPKVEKALQTATDEKGAELDFGEKVDVAAPIYLPAALVGLTTIGCMFGAQIFNVRQQSLLIAAYGLLGQQFAEYRKEVRAEIGDEREREIYISSNKKIRELQEQVKLLEKNAKPHLYIFSSLPGVMFEAYPEHMNNVFHHMTFKMLTEGGFSLYNLYDYTGISKDFYNVKEAKEYGWEAYENEVSWGSPAVTFEIDDVQRSDGQIVHVIDTYVPPYELDLDYGGIDSSGDHIYEAYDSERARSLALASVNCDIEKTDPPDLYFVHTV